MTEKTARPKKGTLKPGTLSGRRKQERVAYANLLIGRHVMGWEVGLASLSEGSVPVPVILSGDGTAEPVPDFSIDGAAAITALERLVQIGHCPNLVYDDDGHWAVSSEGIQKVEPRKKLPKEFHTTVYVERDAWAKTPVGAIFLYASAVAAGLEAEAREAAKQEAR